MQKKKGISLIVLVITIIVMIILAAAIILSLNNAGIIGNANKAVDDTNIANIKAAADLAYAEYLIDKPEGVTDLGKYLTQKLIDNNTISGDDYVVGICDNETVVAKEGTVAFEYYKGNINIGDYINYDYTPVVEDVETTYTSYKSENGYDDQIFKLNESYNSELYGWQVMGIDKEGHLLLLSEDIMRPVDNTGYSYNSLTFFAFSVTNPRTVYLKVKQELENICSLYGAGKGALGARCITIEDVNKITGYSQDDMKTYFKGEMAEYNNKITYSWVNKNGEIKVLAEGTNGKVEYCDASSSFEWFEGNNYHYETVPDVLKEGEKKRITSIINNYYKYYPETLRVEDVAADGNNGKVKEGTVEYDLLFKDKSTTTTNCIYWLASSYIHMNNTTKGVTSGYRRIKTGYVTGGTLMDAKGTNYGNYAGVRAVVSLKPDVVLEKTAETVAVGNHTLNTFDIK